MVLEKAVEVKDHCNIRGFYDCCEVITTNNANSILLRCSYLFNLHGQYVYTVQGVSSLRSLIPFTPRVCLKHQLIHLTIVLFRFIYMYLGSIVVW